MRSKLVLVAVLAVALGLTLLPVFTAPAAAQGVTTGYVSVGNATDDNDTALLVKYVGSSASGKIAVTSGDLVFTHGVTGSEAADTGVTGCGATAGTLAVATCTTIGALLDAINATTNWRAVRIDSRRADTVSSNALIDAAAAQANVAAGLALKWDTSVALQTTRLLAPSPYRTDISVYLSGKNLVANPWLGKTTCVSYMNGTSTYGSGTSTISFLNEVPANYAGAETAPTVNTMYSIAGGATTVNKVISDFEFQPICGAPNARVLVRILNSAACASIQLIAAGKVIPNYTYSTP